MTGNAIIMPPAIDVHTIPIQIPICSEILEKTYPEKYNGKGKNTVNTSINTIAYLRSVLIILTIVFD